MHRVLQTAVCPMALLGVDVVATDGIRGGGGKCGSEGVKRGREAVDARRGAFIKLALSLHRAIIAE